MLPSHDPRCSEVHLRLNCQIPMLCLDTTGCHQRRWVLRVHVVCQVRSRIYDTAYRTLYKILKHFQRSSQTCMHKTAAECPWNVSTGTPQPFTESFRWSNNLIDVSAELACTNQLEPIHGSKLNYKSKCSSGPQVIWPTDLTTRCRIFVLNLSIDDHGALMQQEGDCGVEGIDCRGRVQTSSPPSCKYIRGTKLKWVWSLPSQ